jgi:hypothetical protein
MKFKKEKEKKEISTGHPFSPGGPSTLSAPAHLTPSPFLFPRGADDRGPPVSLSPSPFLSSSPRCPPEPAPPHDSCRAPPLPFHPSLSSRPIKAINLPRDQLEPLPFHKHRAVKAATINGKPPAVPTPTRLAFLPLALFKLAHEPLCLPLPLQHPSTCARAPISPRRRLGFPPPPSIRRRR